MEPCVSVIIPVYQAERFLSKAVNSACSQKEVFEVIIVEDGSSDNSLSLCYDLLSTYASKVKLFRHPKGANKGAGASRNLGLKKAHCEFIAFLDADDYFLENRFKNDLEILLNNSEIDGVYNALGVEIYDKSENNRIDYTLTTLSYYIPANKLFERMAPIGSAGYFSGDALTVRRDIFKKVGYFDTTLELSQDTHMWMKMAAKACLVPGIIRRPVAMRGVHSANRIKDTVKFNYYRPLLFSSLFSWAKENNISTYKKRLIWDQLFVYHFSAVQSESISTLRKIFKNITFLIKYGIKDLQLLSYKNYLHSYLKIFVL